MLGERGIQFYIRSNLHVDKTCFLRPGQLKILHSILNHIIWSAYMQVISYQTYTL